MNADRSTAALARIDAAAIDLELRRLAATASIEIGVRDRERVEQGVEHLGEGRRLFISHMPGQTWEATLDVCRAVRQARMQPVPHLPVRLIESHDALRTLLARLADAAQIEEVLLIAGDYPAARGPFPTVSDVLALGTLEQHGVRAVSLAGHPEGHPKVELDVVRRAEVAKCALARAHGLQVAAVTQFVFDAAPFLAWAAAFRSASPDTHICCGVAGPATLATLLKFGVACGVGPSLRALHAHGGALRNLLGVQTPDRLMRQLAEANVAGACRTDGVHVFSFGGYLKTAAWLHALAEGTG